MPKLARPVEAGQARAIDWPALTLETLVYAVLLGGAAFIRFYALGRWPLLAGEASQALAAWRFLHAQRASPEAVPLLFDSALAGFFLLGASDAAARLLPALSGTALVLLPLGLRRRLGTWGALAATFLLAFSPTLVFYSRTLAGAIPALAGLGAILLAMEYADQGQAQRARLLGAMGLAVALTSSPWVYTALLAGLAFYALGSLARRRGADWPGCDVLLAKGGSLLGDRKAWLIFGILMGLLSTALLMRLDGVQATADLLVLWLARLVPASGGRSFAYPLATLCFYEVGILALGLAGAAVGLRRRSLWAGFLGLWAGLAFVLPSLSGARDAEPVAHAILPLALLAGLAVDTLVTRLRPANWAWVGACLAVLSALLGFWWLQLAAYFNPEAAAALGDQLRLVWVLCFITPAVMVAAGLALWLWVGYSETAWAVALLGLGVAGCLLLRQSASLNHAYARDAREPLLVAPSSVDLRDMVTFLEDWSARKALDQHALIVAAGSDLEPLVPWYLREFEALRLCSAPQDVTEADALVTSGAAHGVGTSGLASTAYDLRTVCDGPLADPYGAFGWWLLRVGGAEVRAETCRLWVRP
ncbi:MAG: hypothetical protein QME94_09075 [Anaerolineae bacterium]|nr:hypothetical protein [Anaerolineae bacterium]